MVPICKECILRFLGGGWRIMAIADERQAFEEALGDLLAEHEGEFVIFFNREQRGFYADFDSAYAAALAEFGTDAEFLVSKIEEPGPARPVSLSWDAGVMFA